MRESVALALICSVAASARADGPVDYLRDIKPVLAEKCYACHGALQQKSGLRVDTARLLLEGSNKGAVLVPGQSDKSPILAHVAGTQGARKMPPPSDGEPLSEKQIALLKAWIDQGAKAPADEKPEADPRAHWAFRPPLRKPTPNASGPSNPIDRYLAAGWAKLGLAPQPLAPPSVLLRRVYLDLIGLPPTREELNAFLRDDAADAYEKVVDKLLASKLYGERWGRHWMDVWRYSDWWGLGQESRHSQKHIWHWRDWIVESLNADKGYDQMLREMLAADELYPDDLERVRATGFLARNYFKFNRTTWLDETIEHTAKGLLGLTFNCAKCHDHKYDPISQKDYYRYRAFFEPYQVRVEQAPGETDYEKNGIPRAFDCNLDAPTYLFVRGDEKTPAKENPLKAGLPRLFLDWAKLDIQAVTLPAEAHNPGLRHQVIDNYLKQTEAEIQAARRALADAKKSGEHKPGQKPPSPDQVRLTLVAAEKSLAAAEMQPEVVRARSAADRAAAQTPPASTLRELAKTASALEKKLAVARAEEALTRSELQAFVSEPAKKTEADKKKAGAQAALEQARKALAEPGEAYTPLRGALKALESNIEPEASRLRPFPTSSTGRRAALARWLTDRNNPLTPRVAVNHIWMRHFGKPLVPTHFDFGRKGTPPTHPELLDYLAVELMEPTLVPGAQKGQSAPQGWRMKHLHRLIVTSQAYRLTSSSAGAAAKNREVDPENRYYWRMNPVRMEAQVLRDSLLHLAGDLDLTMGGPSIPINDETSKRRSIYFVHSNVDNQKFLSLFDDASVRECYRRSESIVPQQALALANSPLTLAMATRLSERLHRELGQVTDAEFVRAAFSWLLAEAPSAEEHAACAQALAEWRALAKDRADAGPRARLQLVQTLLNHNDFITIR